MSEAEKYYRRAFKFLDELTFVFRNEYDKKEILSFHKKCLFDYNFNPEIFRKKRDGLMLTIMIALLGINKESIEITDKFLDYDNLVNLDYRNLVGNTDKLKQFNERVKSTSFDNWLCLKKCPDSDETNADIIRRVRNSLLHSNFVPDFEDEYLSYIYLKTKSYYESTILSQNFYQFVGSYYSNLPGLGLSEFTDLNYTTYNGKINNEKNLREYLKSIKMYNFSYNLENYNGTNSLDYLIHEALNKKHKEREVNNILNNAKKLGINIKEEVTSILSDKTIENIINYFNYKYGKNFYTLDDKVKYSLINNYIEFLFKNKKHISNWLFSFYYIINHSINPSFSVEDEAFFNDEYAIESLIPSLSILKGYLILYRLQYSGFDEIDYEDINFDYNDEEFYCWSEINNENTSENYFLESYNKKRNKNPNLTDKNIKNEILCEIIRNGFSHGNIRVFIDNNTFEKIIEIKDIDKKKNKARCIQMTLNKFNKFLESEAFLPKNCRSVQEINNIKK